MNDQLWEAASYLVAIFGSIFLWINYALFGLIARRYGQVFGKATYSSLLILAPTGLLIYTLFLILKATPLLQDAHTAQVAEWVAYLSLVASGFFCLIGIARFSGVLGQVTRPGVSDEPAPAAAKGGEA
jgi:hypothetical protein